MNAGNDTNHSSEASRPGSTVMSPDELGLCLAKALDALPDKVHVVDPDLRIIMFNESFRRWHDELGLDGDLLGQHISDAFPFLQEDVFEQYAEVFRTGNPVFSEEDRMVTGRRVIAEVAKIPIVQEGRVTRVITVVRDITERRLAVESLRQNESRLRNLESIINRSPAMVFLWCIAPDFPVEFASANVAQLGYTADDFTSGRVSWVALTHPGDEARLRAEVEGYFASGTDEWHQRYRLTAASGEYRWMEDRNLVIRDEAGRPTHIQGIVLDVTERERLEQQIAEVSAREQRRIGMDLHDSLGQDLTCVSLFASSLERDLRKDASPYADTACRIAGLARDAVAQCRMIARGLMPVDLEGDGLAVAIERLAAETEQLSGVPCRSFVEGDGLVHDNRTATSLYYIAREAVNNAVRHGRPTQVTVRLETDREQGVLSVEDDGSGIEEGRNGPGLGLNTMRFRARNIGGHLTVKGEDGRGSTVTCTFPNGS